MNLDFSSGSIGFFFFLILQDGELPLISPPPVEIHRYTVIPNYAT